MTRIVEERKNRIDEYRERTVGPILCGTSGGPGYHKANRFNRLPCSE